MSDLMTFPYSVEEFMERYKIVDTDGIYMSKGAELVPIFRMRQWFEHLPSAQRTGRWIIKETPGTEWYRVTCSACGEDVSSVIPTIGFFPNVKALWDFCPNCGARMEEQE